MENYWWIIVPISILVFLWVKEQYLNSKKYLELKPKLDNLEKSIVEYNEQVKREREDIDKMVKQRSMGFPWLAEAFADYYSLKDKQRVDYLQRKSHPAYSSAVVVSEIKKEKKELLKSNKLIAYKINYYEKLFPWLQELIAENEEDEIPVRIDEEYSSEINADDKVKDFLTQEEYRQLPSAVRNQKALDRYLENRNKSKWAIGRDYEMYIGHLYEQQGYSIEYRGILDGFEDLGRDVIASKRGEICIIQCKYWARYKEIHEKHVFQLFGTTMEYWIKNFKNKNELKTFEEFAKFLNEDKLRPIFITSTSLSSKAKEMATALSIEVLENQSLGNFPRIKCNISGKEGERIYHLPFDQQYDRTIIEKSKGELHAHTVKEAEDAGFRRAFKHKFIK